MQAGFFRAICQVGIFMVCAQTMIHFRPEGSYEKYMKLLVSMMVLMQLLQPLGQLLSWGGAGDLEAKAERIREQMEASMAEALDASAYSEDALERMTLQELHRILSEQASQEDAGASAVAADAREPQGVKKIEPIRRIEIQR